MKPIRFGMTGSGYMGRTHAEAIRRLGPSTAELVAIWGGRRAPGLAQQYGAVCDSSVETLTSRPDIDAIIVTTPQALHFKEVMLALEAGKHVMIEKPMATTVEDCDRMIEAAARRNLVIAMGYNLRFRDNPIRVRELIQQKALGQLLTVHVSQLFNLENQIGAYEWFKDPANIGNIVDALPHTIDLLRWFTGAEVGTVTAFSRTLMPRPGVEDTTVGIIEFTDGALCSVNTSCALPANFPGEHARLRMIGSAGVIDLDAMGDVYLSDKQGWRLVAKQPPIGWEDPNAAWGDVRMKAYRNQMQSFIDGIHGKPMEAGNGNDGRAPIVACLAMLTASRERRWVQLA